MSNEKNKKKSKKRRGFRIPLWLKFTIAVVSLILLIFSSVGYFVFEQQSQDLGRELRQRGRTVAENLAANASEAVLRGEELVLAQMARAAVQSEAVEEMRGFNLLNPQDVIVGVETAIEALPQTAPRYINLILGQLGYPQSWGSQLEKVEGIKNEGVFEVNIHNRAGVVVGHSDVMMLGTQYIRPEYVSLPNKKEPFPIYEQTYETEDGEEKVRRLFDIEIPVEVATDEGSTEVGKVHVGMSRDIIDRAVFEATSALIAIGVIMLIFGAAVTWVFVTWLVRPAGKLLKGVLAIAGGNFDTRIKVAVKDELGALTLAFNDMAKSLGENEMLKGAFSRYVSDAALDQLLTDPSKTGLHSKRVTAAIYSSDVRGFTKMSETLEPEEVVAVINTYLGLQTDVLLKYGGVVDKFIGDAAIGVFGKEGSKPDDTLRCVKAALEIQHKISLLNVKRKEQGKVPKDIGIGINTGEIISGNIGSSQKMEYTIAGDDAMIADVLCDDCPAGKVWITQATYDLVKGDVLVKKVTPMKIKGKDQPVTVYELVKMNE